VRALRADPALGAVTLVRNNSLRAVVLQRSHGSLSLRARMLQTREGCLSATRVSPHQGRTAFAGSRELQ